MVQIEIVYALVVMLVAQFLVIALLAWRLDRTLTVEALYGLADFAEVLSKRTATRSDDVAALTIRRIADTVKEMGEINTGGD